MTIPRFITLTKANKEGVGTSAGDTLVVNVADIVSCEAFRLSGGFIHEGTPNIRYHPDDEHRLDVNRYANGSMLTVKGKDKREIVVEQPPEEVKALIDEVGQVP